MAAEFIQISDTVRLKKSCIEAIEETKEGTIIYSTTRAWPTVLPAKSIEEILEIYKEQPEDTLNKILAIKKTEGSFAG